jgi:hypothetical protein
MFDAPESSDSFQTRVPNRSNYKRKQDRANFSVSEPFTSRRDRLYRCNHDRYPSGSIHCHVPIRRRDPSAGASPWAFVTPAGSVLMT